MKKRPIVMRIVGGLGNQMYQYAFIKALSLKTGRPFKLDITSFEYYFRLYELENFNIEKNYLIPFYQKRKVKGGLRKILYYIYRIMTRFMLYYKEKGTDSEYSMDFGNKIYFEGVYGNYKFFDKYKETIKKDFKYKKISVDNLRIINEFKNRNTVSVHIRRGDYLKQENSRFAKLTIKNYYNKAIKYMEQNVENPIFLFFSDDIEWVKKNFGKKNGYIYISLNNGKNSRQDMILMSKCNHNIIANSTFSFRGAYLNDNTDKIVIGPKKIMEDGDPVDYPNGWITL